MVSNDLFLRVLRGEPVSRTPVWIMRQAGRYLPEYRQTRARAGAFLDLCRNPELACEVTLQPLRRFALDAAILFSDILTVPDAMGLGLSFVPGEGPRFTRTVRSRADAEALALPPAGALDYVSTALRLIRRELNGKVPLIGFCGSPWTIATYVVEGKSGRDQARVRALAYREPQTLHLLLAKLTTALTDYLNAQIAAGAQAVMIFDSWGGVLPHWAYAPFSLEYMAQILAGLEPDGAGNRVPTIVFTKGGGQWLGAMKHCGANALGLDWTTSLAARGKRSEKESRSRAIWIRRCCLVNLTRSVTRCGGCSPITAGGHRHIFNLGHGITPEVPPEHARTMIDAVHELSPAYHGSD